MRMSVAGKNTDDIRKIKVTLQKKLTEVAVEGESQGGGWSEQEKKERDLSPHLQVRHLFQKMYDRSPTRLFPTSVASVYDMCTNPCMSPRYRQYTYLNHL